MPPSTADPNEPLLSFEDLRLTRGLTCDQLFLGVAESVGKLRHKKKLTASQMVDVVAA